MSFQEAPPGNILAAKLNALLAALTWEGVSILSINFFKSFLALFKLFILLFFEFIKSGSFQDRQAQILKMEQVMGELQKRRNYLEKEAYTGGKVALALGSMLGIITVVALI